MTRTGIRVKPILLFLLLAAIAVRLGFFAVSVINIPASFDESITMLEARAIVQEAGSIELEAKQHPRMLFGRFPLLMLAQPYLFPLEAYVIAPFVRMLPANAFGARLLPLAMGILSVLLTGLGLIRLSGWRKTWPGLLLVLWPSSYFLTLQAGYALPGYPAMFLLSGLMLFLAAGGKNAASYKRRFLRALLVGACGGLACSVTLMSAPLLAAFALLVVPGRDRRQWVSGACGYVAGALAGLVPYVLARAMYPGAYAAVSGTLGIGQALSRFFSPAIDFTLPCALGIRPCVFPDGETVTWFEGAAAWGGYATLVFMIICTCMCAWRFLGRLLRTRLIGFETADAMVAACWLAIGLFIFSARSHSGTYRYMLIAVWALPVLAGAAYSWGYNWLRKLIVAVVSVALCFNVAGTVYVMTLWGQPGFAARELYFFDLDPAFDYLRKKSIDRCYATALFCYRINYESREEILCSQPYNERFPGWPLPYKEVVTSSTNVAYVLAPGYRYLPHYFEKDLEKMGVTVTRKKTGPFSIYHDFVDKDPARGVKMPGTNIAVEVSHYPSQKDNLVDGDYLRRWRSHGAQEEGMNIVLEFDKPIEPVRIVMYYNLYHHDRADALDIAGWRDGSWISLRTGVQADLDPFEFKNGHPVYGNTRQNIDLPASGKVRKLRIKVSEVNSGRDWTIGEIEVFRNRSD